MGGSMELQREDSSKDAFIAKFHDKVLGSAYLEVPDPLVGSDMLDGIIFGLIYMELLKESRDDASG
jgi:hypothetical protein